MSYDPRVAALPQTAVVGTWQTNFISVVTSAFDPERTCSTGSGHTRSRCCEFNALVSKSQRRGWRT